MKTLISKYKIKLLAFLIYLISYISIFGFYITKIISIDTFDILVKLLVFYALTTFVIYIFLLFYTKKYLSCILYMIATIIISILFYFSFWLVIGIATTN
jgi:hypothetical protein